MYRKWFLYKNNLWKPVTVNDVKYIDFISNMNLVKDEIIFISYFCDLTSYIHNIDKNTIGLFNSNNICKIKISKNKNYFNSCFINHSYYIYNNVNAISLLCNFINYIYKYKVYEEFVYKWSSLEAIINISDYDKEV